MLVVDVCAGDAGEGVASLEQVASGSWAEAGSFQVAGWTDANSRSETVGDGLHSQAMGVVDLTGSAPAGSESSILKFTTGATGAVRFDALLWHLDESTATWTEMAATIELELE